MGAGGGNTSASAIDKQRPGLYDKRGATDCLQMLLVLDTQLKQGRAQMLLGLDDQLK